jgi:predicted anti-sigma-YlaC factor YlaD
MTLYRQQVPECEWARSLGSQALDAPLSDLDLRRLDAHLAECPACDEAVAAMAELTARLRTAPALAPAAAVAAVRPARRPGRTAFQVAGIAAVVAAFAGLGALVASPSGGSPQEAKQRLVVAERTDLRGTLRDARLTKLWVDNEPGTQRSPHPHGMFA